MSFGAGVTEVEVDLLTGSSSLEVLDFAAVEYFCLFTFMAFITGERRILRADLLLDCGKSLNPAVDIGQVLSMCDFVYSFLSILYTSGTISDK